MIPDFFPAFMRVAYRELSFGPEEVPGDGAHPRILQYHTEGAPKLGAVSDEVAWCAAFIGFCLLHGGLKGTGEALAQSYKTWGRPTAAGTWGSVVVLSRGSEPWMGHVGFCVGFDGSRVYVLGGNQGNRISIREYDASRVLAWRVPSSTDSGSAGSTGASDD